ncbi:protein serine/threonine phosphatase 2C [Pluteus cervinus]|uniref:Protein serine/threonine phosphatase 2C n=1 Tax=Pluteus cervinus TaxID=181527 RepID=A0ACD3BFL5_9AGAR|nr:protein serine/threonine phosphatase 2C [Pluteus cervinus]
MQISSRSATRLSSNVVRKARRRCHPHISASSLRAYATVSQRPYEFHIGASWAGKPEPPGQRPKVPFPADGLIGAWRDKMLALRQDTLTQDAGEDFFFIQQMRDNSGVAFGVADGVGGWVDSGVDPALFSQALMYHCHRYARSAWAGEPEIDPTLDYEEREQVEGWELTPYECLDLAYGGVLRERFVQAGSSTACMISLNASSGLLRSANLGDSGFSIIRASSIFYKQAAQSHFFNCPKQLTKLPANAGRKFSRACVDSPSEAATYQTKLRHGDIIIAYTDGFSDNVFSTEMVTICKLIARAGGSEELQVQTMADRLVDYARQCMMSKSRVSPFEREAARQGMFFRGGKPDDVTVVVGLVRETS